MYLDLFLDVLVSFIVLSVYSSAFLDFVVVSAFANLLL